jgi:hypothetical protein
MRDQVLKANGEEAHMFWDVVTVVPPEQSGTPLIGVTLPGLDGLTSAHQIRRFPATGAYAQTPDRVVVNIHIRPLDYDVIDDLIASGDLDPRFREQVRTLSLLPNRGTASPQAAFNLEWTRDRAKAQGFQEVPSSEQRIPFDCLNLGLRGN